MRNLHELDQFRVCSTDVVAYFGGIGDHETGLFFIPSPVDGKPLKVLAASGDGWEHVSVSRQKRCPSWPEMDAVKRLFFRDDEVCMQLHVATSDYISVHPYCLHLWRPIVDQIPLPPKGMVG